MSASRQLNAVSISVGTSGNVLQLPSANDTLTGNATSASLSNKTLVSVILGTPSSGTLSNCSGLPISGVSGLGSGVATFLATPSSANLASAVSDETGSGALVFANSPVLVTPDLGTPSALVLTNATALPVSSLVGQVAVANGGTGLSALTAHYTVIGNGTSAVSLVAPSTAGFVLTSNGASADPSYQAIPGSTPALNGGSGSPQSVVGAVGIALSGIMYQNFAWVVGAASSDVTVVATPSISAGSADAQQLSLIGTAAIGAGAVTLQDESGLSGSGLSLNGTMVLAANSILNLVWDATQSLWLEMSRR